ncbi:MAG: ParA family protein [Proteobacteria bacterium]|nr:ParA family protein [Pseudomonadota bacterium]MBU1387650.1 ParA family protein [Pseudomonadota bacterium]MBU1543682.1 ParA family protein [Pseudomonadota bacterium]MBU2430825.1 ParA family protein [Pseudomonadota bacterium]MBU2482581.1 ParA family protein [Pseudomonadota bacterium]
MTKIITIAGQKGGTGKSVTAVNFAASLALLEQKTLLIDTDPQGCSTKWCGLKPSEDTSDLTSIFTGRSQVMDAVAKTQVQYMDVIPAGFDLFQAALKLSRHAGNEKILRIFLKDIQGEYEYIIIDSPSSFSFLTITAMMAADSLVVCTTSDQNTSGDFQSLLAMVKYIRHTHDISLKILGFLFNRCKILSCGKICIDDRHLFNTEQMMPDIFIPEDDTIRQSIESAVPCALYDIKSPAARAYLNFANQMHCFFK